MKLSVYILVLVCSACWVQAQETPTTSPTDTTEEGGQCMGRGLGNTLPTIVSNLPEACSTDLSETLQCCSRDYIIERLNVTEEEFRAALREELQERFEFFEGIADRLNEYFDGDFLDGLFASFADLSYLRGSGNVVRQFVGELRESFDIERAREEGNDLNVRDLLDRFLGSIEDEAVSEFGSTQLSNIQNCIKNVIQEKVSDVRMAALAASIEQIRRIRTTLDKLGNFLEMLNTTLGGYRPLQTCVDRLVDRADCDSCIVPRVLCSNWCGALARACYSPFYDTFNGQFRRFWAIVRQVVEQIPRQLQRVNQNRKVIDINPRQFASAIRECSEDLLDNDFLSGLLGKRQADDDDTPLVPTAPTVDLEEITGGAFQYGRLGPRLCRSFSITTRSSRCWDGVEERLNDIPLFTTDTVDGQDENPAIMISMTELQVQAAALGSPVDTLVDDPTFTGTAPEGIEGTGGAVGIIAAVSIMLVSLTIALGVN